MLSLRLISVTPYSIKRKVTCICGISLCTILNHQIHVFYTVYVHAQSAMLIIPYINFSNILPCFTCMCISIMHWLHQNMVTYHQSHMPTSLYRSFDKGGGRGESKTKWQMIITAIMNSLFPTFTAIFGNPLEEEGFTGNGSSLKLASRKPVSIKW